MLNQGTFLFPILCKEECHLLKQKEAEVAALKKEQDLLFLLLELGLIAMERWARENGLLPDASTKFDKRLPDWNNQISTLLDKVRRFRWIGSSEF